MSVSSIISEARKVIDSDEPLPSLDFTIEHKPYCKKCGEGCMLKYMSAKAVLPVSDCCEWFYGLDFEIAIPEITVIH